MLREPRSRWPRPFENKGTPRLHETLAIGDIAITFVNHATFLIQTGGTTILTDPIWSERARRGQGVHAGPAWNSTACRI